MVNKSFQNLNKFLLPILATLGILFVGANGQMEQRINFFLEPFDPEDLDNTMCPLNSSYPIVGFTAMKIPDLRPLIEYELSEIGSYETIGLWATYSSVNYDSTGGGSVAALYGCTAHHDPTENPKSMRYLGNEDASLPGLSLFFDSWPDGEETYVDGAEEEKSFDERLCIGFWALTGAQNWTLYSQMNFEGEAICVMPNEYGFEWGSLDYAFVGSVRLGCDTNIFTLEGHTSSLSVRGEEDPVMIQVTKEFYQKNFGPKTINGMLMGQHSKLESCQKSAS